MYIRNNKHDKWQLEQVALCLAVRNRENSSCPNLRNSLSLHRPREASRWFSFPLRHGITPGHQAAREKGYSCLLWCGQKVCDVCGNSWEDSVDHSPI